MTIKQFEKSKRMISWLYFITALGLCTGIWFMTYDFWTVCLAAAASVVFFSLFTIIVRLFDSCTVGVLEQLSEMIQGLSAMREEEIFTSLEENLLSKIQSQIMKLNRVLKAQNRLVEEERNEIKALISDISHQLKTPIANLQMYGTLLQEKELSDQERSEFFLILQDAMDKLTFLTENMIKMSRLEGGVIQLRQENRSINETVLKSLKQVYRKADEKQIQITLDERQQIMADHDRRWTAEAVFNILDNAVKYISPGGEISICLQQYELFCRIDITDNGPGIPEQEQANIFRRFYRGRNTGDTEGIGLGLYLSREIIARQGGYIKVYSREGTKFSIFLPLSENHQEDSEEADKE